ncbi:hypothetical protein BGX26_000415 [Mortierella sp. AD094]|nr:hypothetical protein BGX26_000415 [Mortierella sp. AD094]
MSTAVRFSTFTDSLTSTLRLRCDRGLVFGRIYKEDGVLVVNVAQEGPVKLRDGATATSSANFEIVNISSPSKVVNKTE